MKLIVRSNIAMLINALRKLAYEKADEFATGLVSKEPTGRKPLSSEREQ